MELAAVIPVEAMPLEFDGMVHQNMGCGLTDDGRLLWISQPFNKVHRSGLRYTFSDSGYRQLSDAKHLGVRLSSSHDFRLFRYPSGALGFMCAYLTTRVTSREDRSFVWGQAHAEIEVSGDTMTYGGIQRFPGRTPGWGHKNFIPYRGSILYHPALHQLIDWKTGAVTTHGDPLPIELRGGTNAVDCGDPDYDLIGYHVVRWGPSGRKIYDAYLGFITKAHPHRCVAWFRLDTEWAFDLTPEVLNHPYRHVERVAFPMAMREVCGDYDVITGIQDGATFVFTVSGADIATRLASLRSEGSDLALVQNGGAEKSPARDCSRGRCGCRRAK